MDNTQYISDIYFDEKLSATELLLTRTNTHCPIEKGQYVRICNVWKHLQLSLPIPQLQNDEAKNAPTFVTKIASFSG